MGRLVLGLASARGALLLTGLCVLALALAVGYRPLLVWYCVKEGADASGPIEEGKWHRRLERMGPRIAPWLRRYVSSEDADVRRFAVIALGACERAEDVDLLLERLASDPCDRVRYTAALCANPRMEPRALPQLIKSMRSDSSVRVQQACAQALLDLARLGNEAARASVLATAMDEKHAAVAAYVCASVGFGWPEPEKSEMLRAFLAHKDPEVRDEALRNLALVGDRAAIAELVGRLKEATTPGTSGQIEAWRDYVLTIEAGCGKRVGEALTPLLQSPVREIRAQTAESLARQLGASALPLFRGAVQASRETWDEIRNVAEQLTGATFSTAGEFLRFMAKEADGGSRTLRPRAP